MNFLDPRVKPEDDKKNGYLILQGIKDFLPQGEMSPSPSKEVEKMNAIQVQTALREERKKLLAESKRRAAKILELYREQQLEDRLDRGGALWGETQFSALPSAAEVRWDGDLVGKYVSYHRTPERIVMMRQLFHLVSKTVRALFGGEAYKLFLEWLRGATVAELAEEKDIAFTQLLRQIKAMVAACRKRVGSDPEVFPFKETAGEQGRRVNQRRADRRRREGKTVPADEAARVYLSEAERAMPLDRLWETLKAKGHNVSRPTAWRGKRAGFYYPTFENPTFGTRRIELTADERQAPSEFLAKRFSFTVETARKAKKRGWFAVDVNTRHRITVPEDRTVPPEQLTPQIVTRRVELAAQEREAFPEFLAERFGISTTTACCAKKRGWFAVDGTNRERLKIPEDRSMPEIFPGKKVKLTAAEKKLSLGQLTKRFGIERTTARVARQRGYFVIMARSIGRITIPETRSVLPAPARRGRRPKAKK